MDLVEIVVRTEDAFGITIPDADATRITTPRELADFVTTKVSLSDESSCLSQQAFYFLRERFQSHLLFSRQSFRPNTPLEKIVPMQNRQLIWSALRTEVGANALPDLARPIWLFWTLAVSTIFVFFIHDDCYLERYKHRHCQLFILRVRFGNRLWICFGSCNTPDKTVFSSQL